MSNGESYPQSKTINAKKGKIKFLPFFFGYVILIPILT
jgi:hypothetical protein